MCLDESSVHLKGQVATEEWTCGGQVGIEACVLTSGSAPHLNSAGGAPIHVSLGCCSMASP